MSRKPRVQRTPEEKWQIVLEGLKSGNIAETCRKFEIAPNLYYRWKDEVEAGARAALGGRSAAAAGRGAGAGAGVITDRTAPGFVLSAPNCKSLDRYVKMSPLMGNFVFLRKRFQIRRSSHELDIS